MSLSEPFPEEIWREIRDYPGNHKCCDCQSLDTDWGSITHGTLICLECAGKHRSLGVQTSFVRSLTMDTWSKTQVEMMRQGGNDQIRRFFKKLEIENSPVQTLYCTKGANHYRERLKERVDKIISGDIISEKRVISGHTRSQSLKVMPKIGHDQSHNADHNNLEVSINIVFKSGPMGMTLTKDYRDMAVVSKLMPGGPAQCSGVRVGDYIAGVSGKAMVNYDEIMHMIPCMSRPLTIRFNRRNLHHGQLTHGQAPGAVLKGCSSSNNMATSLPNSFHSSRSESSLTSSVAAEAFTESYHQQESGLSSGEHSRSTSKDFSASDSSRSNSRDASSSGSAYSLQQLQQHTMKGIAMEQHSQQHPPSLSTPHKLVRVRSARTVPKNGSSASDGDDAVITSAKLTPRGSRKQPPSSMSNSSSPEVSPTDRTIHVDTSISFGLGEDVEDSLASTLNKKLTFTNIYTIAATDSLNGEKDENSVGSAAGANSKYLEPGSIVRVMQLCDEKYRSAVITRRHKDGTFKVMYRDESTEARVTVSRMVTTSGSLSDASPSTSSQEHSSKHHHTHHSHHSHHNSVSTTPCAEELTSKQNVDLWQVSGVGEQSSRSSSPKPTPPVKSGLVTVVFQAPPLGLTLTSTDVFGEPGISRVVDGGRAMQLGLRVGDVMVCIDGTAVHSYDEAMRVLSGCVYPLSLQFKRNNASVVSEETVFRTSFERDSKLQPEQSPQHSSRAPSPSPLTRRLSPALAPDEVDVNFSESDLGFSIGERVGAETMSVVVEVISDGAAERYGIRVGWTLLGINHEKYISHAHSVATLKYVKKPVVIRFKGL